MWPSPAHAEGQKHSSAKEKAFIYVAHITFGGMALFSDFPALPWRHMEGHEWSWGGGGVAKRLAEEAGRV